jgi:hypothetical protein
MALKISKVTRQVAMRADLAREITLAQRDAERQARSLGYPMPGFRVYVTVEQDFMDDDKDGVQISGG